MGLLERYKRYSRRRYRRAGRAHTRLDIQGLRMVAVLTVFACHLWHWPRGGFVGVDVFFVISGVGQALAGFLVDRVGARPVLFAGLSCFVAAGASAALASGYPGLMLAAALAGLGNAPFHPVDFTILNKRVSTPRLGHAFSIHGISGNLGWALAPVFLIGLSSALGSWRLACACAAVMTLCVIAVLLWQRDALDDHHSAHRQAVAAARANGSSEHPMAFLKLPSVWLCFSFFFWSTAALSAIQSFASPALHQIYGLPLAQTAYVVTGYMLAGALGMALERRAPWRDLPFLPVQRFGYRQLMYCVVVKSVVTAIQGGRVGWGKLERRATVTVAARR